MDIILYNGNIITMDENNPKAGAVAIKGNKIIAVGKDEEVLNLKNKDTEIIDLNLKTLVPGFIDSHMHMLDYAQGLESVDLENCKSIEEIKDKLKDIVKNEDISKDKLIIGIDWNEDNLLENRFPRKEELDAVTIETPMIIVRRCGNIAVLNTKAVEKFSKGLKDIYESKKDSIEVDEEGNFTGLIKGNDTISLIIPPFKKEDIEAALLKVCDHCIKNGLTSVQADEFISADMEDVLEVFFKLANNNKLPIRVYKQLRLPTIDKLNRFLKMGYKTGDGDEFFKIGPLKLVIDGVLGARTAALRNPYSDDPTNVGILIYEQDELDEITSKAYKNGLQIAIHGIGDRAIDMIFDTFIKALEENPKDDPRFRIIHSQITAKDHIDKYKKYNVIADVQPAFISSDLPIVESRVGEERAKWTYNWKRFLERGIHISAGSDSPIESFNPLIGIYAFVTRQTLDGYPEEGWLPEQKLTVYEAIYAYTMGAAYSSFEEDIKGSITPGKLADMVVLSDDIFNIDSKKIKDIKVEKTIIDGKVVYEI